MATEGSAGVVNRLAVTMRPLTLSLKTKSVNVPPMSQPTRHLLLFIALNSRLRPHEVPRRIRSGYALQWKRPTTATTALHRHAEGVSPVALARPALPPCSACVAVSPHGPRTSSSRGQGANLRWQVGGRSKFVCGPERSPYLICLSPILTALRPAMQPRS